MKSRLSTIILLSLGLFLLAAIPVFAEDISSPFPILGRIQGTGSFFEIKDSQYLNITLESSEEITVALESVPKIISLTIEAFSVSSSTILTFSNLEPNKTYYKYEDSYKNGIQFFASQDGTIAFTQDLIMPHHIWLQETHGTIYIPDKCSDYGTWDESTLTCILSQDLTESIEITINNITLDCNNHKIAEVNGNYGIYLNRKSGVKIKNCIVNNFSYGIYSYLSFNTILSNNITDSNYYGIYSNTASRNYFGITISNSINSILDNNILLNNDYGLYFYGSGGSAFTNNRMFDNNYNFYLEGNFDSDFNLDIDTSNTVDNKPIYYVKNAADQTYDNSTNAGAFYCISCNNVTVKDLTLAKNTWGIFFWKTQNSRIENVKAFNNVIGIDLRFSTSNILTSNIANSNNYAGIRIWHSDTNTLNANTANSNLNYGILLDYSHSNILTSNNINSNFSHGVYLADSKNNIFDGNTIVNNPYGIEIAYSNDNNFINNTISNNSIVGVILSYGSANNKIYYNNFIDNALQMNAYYGGSGNLFDSGYPDGGNYWSDYTGIDEKSGENQDQSGSDGIGDTPYTFYGGQDGYPFMNEKGWEAPQEPEKWSFAIITDLHIGQFPKARDYGEKGWDDGDSIGSEDKISVKNLKKIVELINSSKERYNLRFVVVTGDFTDSAELSEMNKAKEILDILEIPWVPLIGNHDIWPYTSYTRLSNAPEVDTEQNGTDKYFNDIFNSQYEKLKGTLQNWDKAEIHIWNPETNPNHYSYFQNFAFDYNSYYFMGLDFNHRDNEVPPLPGSAAAGNLHNFASGSWDWLTNRLIQYYHNHPKEQEKIILLAHHPFRGHYSGYNIGFTEGELEVIDNFLKYYKDKIAFEFAGHTHDKKVTNFENIMKIVETQANVEGPVTRIVQFYPDGKIDYSQLLPEKMMIAKGHSPIDLEITDPDGLKINKQISEIPGASYFEEDTDGDDEPDDIIEIPERKMGEYQIRVIPEDGANPEDTYTLEVSVLENTFGYVPILLAEDIPISETPTEPYLLELKERETTQITYTGELNGQYSDSINLSAVLSDIDGNPLTNKTVNFEIGEQSISAITNESGVASAVLFLNQISGKYYLVEGSFAGDEDYLPSMDSEYFEILKENIVINVIEKEGFAFDEIILEAGIKDDDGQTPLPDTEIEFKIDSRTLGIAKIDEEGAATISWQVDLIPEEPTEDYLIEVIFAGNDYYQLAQGAANFILKSAKWLKQDAVSELESAKTGNKKNDKEIDRVIWLINQSKNENLWIDASHLVFFEKGKCENLNLEKILDKDELDLEGIGLKCLKSGIVVFYYEKMAVRLMMPRPVFEPVIGKLVKADKLLAKIALYEAKQKSIQDQKLKKVIDKLIYKAEKELIKADEELQKQKPDKAILRLAKAWLYAQTIIKLTIF